MKISGSRQIREELRYLNNVLLGFNLCNTTTYYDSYTRYQFYHQLLFSITTSSFLDFTENRVL